MKVVIAAIFSLAISVVVAQDEISYAVPDSMLSEYLSTVSVRAERAYINRDIKLSRQQFMTMAGALEDPTRLLIKYPGISTANDQANSVIYRGMPSHFHQWTMYGARILNPNHQANAGTISDLPSRTAGGVNMLSGQVIGSLDFRGQPSEKSSFTLGGTSDIKLRDGYKNGLTTNLSLIGLEAGIDRVSKDRKNNFLLNYRYSTVGLLTSSGLDFGGEDIRYQDLTSKYSFGDHNNKWTIFGSVGLSTNQKDAIADGEVPVEVKELQDIDFGQVALVAGVNYAVKKDNQAVSNTTLNISHRNVDRTAEYLQFSPTPVSDYESTETMVALHSDWIHRKRGKNGTNRYTFGYIIDANVVDRRIDITTAGANASQLTTRNYDRATLQLVPRVTFGHPLFSDWHLESSLGVNIISGEESKLAPVGSLAAVYNERELSGKVAIALASQATEPELEILGLQNDVINSMNIDITGSYKGIGGSLFWHRLNDLAFFPSHYFSAVSELDQLPIAIPTSSGDFPDATTIAGGSIFINRNVGGVDVSANATLLADTAEDEIELASNFGHMLNMTLSKSWRLKSQKLVGVSAAVHYRGGAYQAKVDLDKSQDWGYTVADGSDGLSLQLEEYFRSDLRIYYKPSKRSTISLDIQNVTGRENAAYYFYEPLTQQSTLKRQLGLIPILSWRVHW